MPKDTPFQINASQIKAARALLDWSQEDLAHHSGLSVATIRKLELGHMSPRGKTIEALHNVFETARIELIQPMGVNLRGNDLTVLEGEDCYLQLLDDIYYTTKGKQREVLFLYADSSLPNEEETQSLNRIRKNGIKWRFLIEEGNTHMNYPIDEYRWFPKKFFKRNIQVIYGTKVALGSNIDQARDLTTKMVIIDSPLLAQSMKNLFEFIWESCRKPPFSTAAVVYE